MPSRSYGQALGVLFTRYRAAFAQAWSARHDRDGKHYQSHEAAFLPAALALQEAPVSPLPRVTMWLLIGFAVLAFLWSVFGKVDIVATAQGKIVTSDRTKTIQALETSRIKAIHVRDGQSVRAGDVLIDLDADSATADSDRLSSELVTAQLQSARARVLLDGLQDGRPSSIPLLPDVPAARIVEAQRHAESLFAEFRSKVLRIEADIQRREAELRSTQTMVGKLEQTVPIARQRAADYKALVAQNFVAKHAYMEREQSLIEQESDLANQRSRLQEIDASMREARAQKVSLLAETRRIALDSLADGDQKAASLHQEVIKADTRGKTMRLTAPVDGTVQQLAVHTVGGVVTPAQPLMMVVPNDTALEVEAFLENKDIGFVDPAQEAEVKIETFPYTKYGTLKAQVKHVSHDAINDEKRGLIYSMRVKLERATMQVEHKTVTLTPGMAVTVEVKTGKRRLIEYFMSPVLQAGQESLRER